MTIDRDTTEMIMDEVRDAAKTIFAKHGLEFSKIRGKYGDLLSITLEGVKIERGASGVNLLSSEAQYYTRFGFSALSGQKLTAPLGTKFINGGKAYIFAGIAAKRRKYPIYCLNADTSTPVLFTEALIATINNAAEKAPA